MGEEEEENASSYSLQITHSDLMENDFFIYIVSRKYINLVFKTVCLMEINIEICSQWKIMFQEYYIKKVMNTLWKFNGIF